MPDPSLQPVDVVLMAPPSLIVFNPAHDATVIRTSGAYPPLGLASVAGAVEADGVRAAILDLAAQPLPREGLVARLRQLQPKLVGIGGMTLSLPSIGRLVELARQALPEATIVVGGPCMEDYPREVLVRLAGADLGVMGEGEETFRDIVRRRLGGRQLTEVEGTVFRRGGEVVMAAARELIHDLDALPAPAHHLVDYRRYAPVISRGRGFATLYTSRGCPFNCRYCHRQGWLRRVRYHSPQRVVDDMTHLVKGLGVREIKFYDETFTLDRRRVLEICRLLRQSGLQVPWEIRTRPELLDLEMTRELAASGCYRVCVGVEAGSQERLDRMGRTTKMADIHDAFRWAHQSGLSTLAFFMIGYPGDTRRDYEDVLRLACQIGPSWIVVAVTSAYANTEIYRQLLDSGRLARDVWRDYTLGLTDRIDTRDITFDGKDYGRDELEAMVSRLYWRFYFRWGQIGRLLREIRSARQLANLGRMAAAFGQALVRHG